MLRKLLLGFMVSSIWTFFHIPVEGKSPALRSDHISPDGLNYELPKSTNLHAVDIKVPNCIGKDCGGLRIDKEGNVFFNVRGSGIKSLTGETTITALGQGSGPVTEGETTFWTYNVLSVHSFEPNIYHVDVERADAEGHWKRYRIRGYLIANPAWQIVR